MGSFVCAAEIYVIWKTCFSLNLKLSYGSCERQKIDDVNMQHNELNQTTLSKIHQGIRFSQDNYMFNNNSKGIVIAFKFRSESFQITEGEKIRLGPLFSIIS